MIIKEMIGESNCSGCQQHGSVIKLNCNHEICEICFQVALKWFMLECPCCSATTAVEFPDEQSMMVSYPQTADSLGEQKIKLSLELVLKCKSQLDNYEDTSNTGCRKFAPKFVSGENPPNFFRGRVTATYNPWQIYCQVHDDEFFQFLSFVKEFQAEMSQNGKTIPNPLIGHAYAVKNGNQSFFRALVEHSASNRYMVLFVDTGFRTWKDGFDFYHLPGRFMELPAQALCIQLDGLKAIDDNQEHQHSYLAQYRKKDATFFVESWESGCVGMLGSGEANASVVVYLDGASKSLNTYLLDSSLVISTKRHDKPSHGVVRLMLRSRASKPQTLASRLSATTPTRSASEPGSFFLFLPVGGIEKVIFVRCDSPSAIYFRTHEMQKRYTKLKMELHLAYKNAHLKKPLENLRVGSKGAISEDGDCWLRVRVIYVKSVTECSVVQLDTGIVHDIKSDGVFPIPFNFLNLPPFVLHCSLNNVSSQNQGNWDREVSERITRRMKNAQDIYIKCCTRTKSFRNPMEVIVTYKYQPINGQDGADSKDEEILNLNEELVNYLFSSKKQ